MAQGVPETPRLPRSIRLESGSADLGSRQAYFGPEEGWQTTPIVSRAALAGEARAGPLIVEEYDSTTVVRPGWRAELDDWNDIVLTRIAAPGPA